jgi:hypothetical protein
MPKSEGGAAGALTGKGGSGALRGMQNADEFERRVTVVVERFFTQKSGSSPSVADTARFAAQLRQLVAERGLPRPLAPGEVGAPGGMAEEECAPLVARVAARLADPGWADAARQLVKACFYPEFTVCRDSFREVARDGSCRRQELERVRGRISGAHCVDCPHWVALEPAAHADYLACEWRGDPAELARQRGVFLPEDFRALRQWLHAAART